MPPKKQSPVRSRIKDASLADAGRARIEWAASRMPVLTQLADELARTRPLEGFHLSACLHVTKETAVLMRTLRAAGARVALSASNPLSTQDDVAAALAAEGTSVFAERGIDEKGYYACVDASLDHGPHFTMDDGGDLVTRLHTTRTELLPHVKGGTEETTTGVTRFRAMAADGVLQYPIIAVNDARTKHFFDNRYGTGQSTIDGVLRATSMLFAGRRVVIAGYGWVGRGIATRARGMGARVAITEVDPVRALEALMDGHDVLPLADAAREADLIVTATGNKLVVDEKVLAKAKDGVILANAGHFDHEVDVAWLRKNAKHRQIKDGVDEYTLKAGNRVVLLGEGRLVNLAMAEGHPPEVMDMSFANQALAALYLAGNAHRLKPGVYTMPHELDEDVAMRKLKATGVRIDKLTKEQKTYMTGWKEGT